MKQYLVRQYLFRMSPLVDIAMLPIVVVFSPLMLLFRKFSAGQLPLSSKLFQYFGIWPIRRHYYEPLFHTDDLNCSKNKARNICVELNEQSQLDLIDKANFSDEILALDWSGTGETDFDITNGRFESGDAEALYNLVRHFKPKTIIEVGSGHSTKVAMQALARNAEQHHPANHAHPAEHICIEPFEQPWLDDLGPKIIRDKVEDTGDFIISSLEENDILFIDSSHMIRPQGDVLFEYLELIPRLKKGVIVHIHDIFTPRDYPIDWITNKKRLWNEQYLLECLLMKTERYEIQLALNFMKHSHFDRLNQFCPYLKPESEPGSLYFKVRS